MSDDCLKIQKALGEKVGFILGAISMSAGGFVIGFIYGWKLSFCCLGIAPVMFCSALFMTKALQKSETILGKAYQKSGGLAEEAMSNVKTVYSFCAEKAESKRYMSNLKLAKKAGKVKGIWTGLGIGVLYCAMDCIYGIGFFIGSYFIEYEVYNTWTGKPYDVNSVMIVFLTITFGFFALGQTAPFLGDIYKGRLAAAKIFRIMEDRETEDIHMGTQQIEKNDFTGHIRFSGVHFSYPSRPNVKIFNNLNLKFELGRTTAICGETGRGKASIIKLLEKFLTFLWGYFH